MSKLKSADLSCSPFPYAEAGDVFEGSQSRRQYQIVEVSDGTIYWRELDDRAPQTKGICRLP